MKSVWLLIAVAVPLIVLISGCLFVEEHKLLPENNTTIGGIKEPARDINEKIGDEFCGVSTHGPCSSDEECVKGGCSGEVCQSVREGEMITTCEWRDCYDSKKYGYGCRCVAGECQWVRG